MSTQPPRHYALVERAIHYIRAHADTQPSLGEIAAAVQLSETHLQRVFSEWAGVSPKRFLQFLSKERARQALQASADVLQASLVAGLSSPGRLHDLMVTCEAMTPGEIRLQGAGLQITHGVAETPFGPAHIAWTARGICHMDFTPTTEEHLAEIWPRATFKEDLRAAQTLAAQIFPATPQAGKIHLLLRGTNFQIKVWEALIRIPPGELRTYSQLATMISTPRAQRAVGSALAANTLAYLIPCHRVIREGGDTGQYRWGSERKQAMQGWEAAQREGETSMESAQA